MKPFISKLNLTGHITFSLGWLGAVVVFFALAIVGLTSPNLTTTNAAYVAMELSGWYVIVPFCLASLITGIIQGIGTKWGLFKYYWVTVKLFLTVFITVFLLLHMQAIATLGGLAAAKGLASDQEYSLRVQTIADAGAAIIALLFITTISVYKPWGLIRRAPKALVSQTTEGAKKPFGFYILLLLAVLVLVIIIMHVLGGGMRH